MARISMFIIGMIVASMIVIAFSEYFVAVSNEYNVNYDNTTLQQYEQFANLTELAEETRTSSLEIASSASALDLLGYFFSQAYTTLKITFKSFDIFYIILDQSGETLLIGGSTTSHISAIVLITLFVGVLLAVLVKWIV